DRGGRLRALSAPSTSFSSGCRIPDRASTRVRGATHASRQSVDDRKGGGGTLSLLRSPPFTERDAELRVVPSAKIRILRRPRACDRVDRRAAPSQHDEPCQR